VGDLPALWHGAERASSTAVAARPIRKDVYPLRASADARAKARESLPPEMLEQVDVLQELGDADAQQQAARDAWAVFAVHDFIKSTQQLGGLVAEPNY
jgi:hypothetical protein